MQFRLLKSQKEMPSGGEEIERLGAQLEAMLVKREEGELRRMRDVIGVATGEKCQCHTSKAPLP